jgi:Tfp pilus assembly PilM family ATPase
VRLTASLPLGIDLGSARLRIALSERVRGKTRLAAVAGRDLPSNTVTAEAIAEPELVAAVIEDAYREIGTRERRCVFSVGAEVASLRLVRFPAMSVSERRRAARFEAERIAPWDLHAVPTVVRTHPVHRIEHVYGVGTVRTAALTARVACIGAAGLRPIAADYEACALRRAFPAYDAVLDVGHRRATLHAFAATGPLAVGVGRGGAEMTRAIASDLGIDASAAERRKCVLGNAGAGVAALDEFVEIFRSALAKTRERVPALRRVAVTGNGSRLAGLLETIESLCDVRAEFSLSEALESDAYPNDVLRAGAQDWTLAASLASWAIRQ